METSFPFPVAFPHYLIDAARGPADRYERILQCYEATVRYCATVQLSDYLGAGCPDAALNRTLLERLGRTLALGHWIELVRQITLLQKQGSLGAFVPEMVPFYFRPGRGTALTPEAELFESVLCNARNEWAHRDQTWGDETYRHKAREARPLLDRLLRALSFLGRYTLLVPYRGPRPGVVSEALVLMGPTDPPRLEDGLDLELSPRVRDHLEYEATAFLVDSSDPRRQLLLCPLSVFANRGGAEDIFLFDGCDLRKQIVRRLFYRAVRIGQSPLEVAPGSDRERLVQTFRSFLEMLGEGGEGPRAPDAAAELSAHYFSAQQEVIDAARGPADRYERILPSRPGTRTALGRAAGYIRGHPAGPRPRGRSR